MSDKTNTKKTKISMLKAQRIVALALVLVLVLSVILVVLAKNIVQSMPKDFTDPNDGTLYHIKKQDGKFGLYYTTGQMCERTDDGEFITKYGSIVTVNSETGAYYVNSDKELIFERLYYDVYDSEGKTSYPNEKIINRVDVKNIHGSYAFVRDSGNYFLLEGHAEVEFSQEAFVYLTMACAYPLSEMKLENPKTLPDGSIDLAEYGLAAEKRVEIITDGDGNETEREYDYFPTKATITVKSGKTYTLYFGDATVTEQTYYARYEGKDGIYILSSSGIGNYLTQGIESVITPMIVHPMTSTDYVHVEDFILYGDIDHEKINAAVNEKFPDFDFDSATEREIAEYKKYYSQLLYENSKKDCHFSFSDLSEREGSIYESLPFISKLEYSGGYYINSSNVTLMLQDLYETSFEETVKLDPSQSELEKYGLVSPDRIISYTYYYTGDDGEKVSILNEVKISAQNSDGSYYAYSERYDMIVKINESSLGFLEWDELDWYDPSFMQYNINHVNSVILESSGGKLSFALDSSLTADGSYFPITDMKFEDDNKKSYEILSTDGGFKLHFEGNLMSSVYSNDFLLTGIPFSQGAAEGEDYLFAEVEQTDTNGDGENDAYIYYYYNITLNEGKYTLYAAVMLADAQGNAMSSPEGVIASPTYSSNCFITAGFSQYLFLVPKNSSIGKTLDENYTSKGAGQWIDAEIYVTAQGQYVLINPKDGMFSKISSVSNPVYISSQSSGKLQASGVDIDLFGADETVYCNTGEVLSYNRESGKFELYNKATGNRRDAQKSELAPGVWGSCDFYVTDTGDLVGVDSQSGDAGVFQLASSQFLSSVYANGKELNYVFDYPNGVGSSEKKLAIYNFQQFYTGLLFGSFEGMCENTPEELEELRSLDKFDGSDDRCMLRLTMHIMDNKGNRVDVVYRFYRLSERRAYVTIEALDGSGESSSENAYGSFYVLSSYVEKLISDANKVVSGDRVVANSKY